MDTLMRTKHISVSIGRPAKDVYEFASNPENLPKWATGLSGSIGKVGDEWDSPMGKIRIKFAPKNDFGILDHDVTLESGERFYNPMRVFQNGAGSELLFTLFQHANMTEKRFSDDAETVEKDLKKLKAVMES